MVRVDVFLLLFFPGVESLSSCQKVHMLQLIVNGICAETVANLHELVAAVSHIFETDQHFGIIILQKRCNKY